jgi:predicted lipoprotein
VPPRSTFVALVAFLLLAGAPSAASAADLDAAGEVLRREVLAPLHAAYAEAAAALAAVQPGCDAADDWRPAVRPAFAEALLAWRRLEAAGYGPAAVPETAGRVYFWPDRHGTAGRQLAAALRARDPELENAAGLAGRSAGLHSLAALEVLLHGDAAPAGDDGFACRFAAAIADFQAGLARAIAADFARGTATPGAEVTAGLVHGARATLDVLIALDLERPLGANLAAARGERARAWRSDLSLPLIAAALDTVERVCTAPGGIPTILALGPKTAALDAVLRGRIAASRAALARIEAPLWAAVADPAKRPRVEATLEELRAVRRLMVERLAPALGLALGFNALDGD